MTWILTRTGRRFDLLAPKADQVSTLDIAHALSQLCRFNGHTSRHYSVAQHSLLVASIVPAEHQLAALLHDATEAYVGDMTRPLKALLPDFSAIEHGIWLAICERLPARPATARVHSRGGHGRPGNRTPRPHARARRELAVPRKA